MTAVQPLGALGLLVVLALATDTARVLGGDLVLPPDLAGGDSEAL
jgi:hypothetical protein